MAQTNWWWCHKCQGLFFAGNPVSVCPAGGGHEKPPSGNSYVLPLDDTDADVYGQDNGRFGGFASGVKGESIATTGPPGDEGPQTGYGVLGITSHSFENPGFVRKTLVPWGIISNGQMIAGVAGINWGLSDTVSDTSSLGGVVGRSDTGSGIVGFSDTGRGVWGMSGSSIAVAGDAKGGAGVWGHSSSGPGVHAESDNNRGIEARGNPAGHFDGKVEITGDVAVSGTVTASAKSGTGLWGHSDTGPGVHAESQSSRGIEASGTPAGHFNGNVEVTGTIHAHDVVLSGNVEVTGTIHAHDVVLSNGDLAEEFDCIRPDAAEPGTVMVLNRSGTLEPSTKIYDTKVVGIVSGAGKYGAAIVLDKRDGSSRVAVALMGKAFCKVDATEAPVDVGDLLTSSSRPGHAMKATDASQAFGAVIGKALQPLTEGQGMIAVLIGLR